MCGIHEDGELTRCDWRAEQWSGKEGYRSPWVSSMGLPRHGAFEWWKTQCKHNREVDSEEDKEEEEIEDERNDIVI